ncbi:MAG: peptide deformylase [Sulfurimonas sp.]|nr:peptide deformylase [Sulfurimonas sp.]
MIKEITKYPTTASLEFGANVRHFNDELFNLIQDLKDTMEANGLNALAGFQIGSPLAVILIKDEDGEFLELINPKVLTRAGTVTPTETTAYFPGLSTKTIRYKKIKVMYEDRYATQKFLEAESDLSITIQRKIDYLFGSNFRIRLGNDEKKLFDSKLEFGTDSITQNDCPTVFKRDRILHLFKYLFVAGLLGIASKFFISQEMLGTLVSAENYTMLLMSLLIIIYFFYAQYEGKQYKHCTSCQIGNIIGTTLFSLIKLGALFLLNFFILW